MKVTIYQAPDGWRWRAQAANNEIVASGEAYTRKADAQRAAKHIFENREDGDVTIEAAEQ